MEDNTTCNLTHEQAKSRSQIIKSKPEYSIFLNLNKGTSYSGIVIITFEVTTNTEPLFLDFAGEQVTKLILNGTSADTTSTELHKGGHIHLTSSQLQTDSTNKLEIHFKNKYSDSEGLHTYTGVNGKQFLKVESEPFDNNKVVPYFDQPDIKGRFTLQTLIPHDWTIVTLVQESQKVNWANYETPAEDDLSKSVFEQYKAVTFEGAYDYYTFPQSEILPTYLLAFNVGPWEKVELAPEKRYKNIPMALYFRPSLREYILPQADNFFEYNLKALEFYEETFSMDYMFPKLDSIVVPEAGGAMEYPGAITYGEDLFPRGENTIAEYSKRGRYILHEVSHMWFGNAVSLKWWNDTWLKESFADYVMFRSANDIKFSFPVDSSMLNFFLEKQWGYQEDFRLTSHPIAGEVNSTQEAVTVFDGISYSKGAAVLKQLVFLIGYEKFKAAMKIYFERHAWGNTELKDLMDVYQESLGDLAKEHPAMNIQKWADDWLGTAGTNALKLEWTKESSKVVVHQTAVREEFPTLRYHKIRIAFFDENVKVVRTQDVYINNEATTELDLGDLSGVAAILPNYEDFDFVYAILDEKSRDFFTKNLQKIEDPLTQALIQKSFYDMVKTCQIPPAEFCDLTVNALTPGLSNEGIESIFEMVDEIYYNYLKDGERKSYSRLIFNKVLKMAIEEKDKTCDRYEVIIKKLIEFAIHDDDVDTILTLHDSIRLGFTNAGSGIDSRWKIVRVIFRSSKIGPEVKKSIFDKLYAEDTTDTKVNYKYMIDAMVSRGEERTAILDACINEEKTMTEIIYTIAGLMDISLPDEERVKILTQYSNHLIKVHKERGVGVSRAFSSLKPRVDDLSGFEQKIVEALGQLKEGDDYARVKLSKLKEEVRFIIKSRSVVV